MAQAVKNYPANVGDTRDTSLIPRSGRLPGERNGNLLRYFLPGKFHGQRRLVGSAQGVSSSQTRLSAQMLDTYDFAFMFRSLTCLGLILYMT